MPTKPTPPTKHTTRRSTPKLLRIPYETHRALKWVALQRETTMTACLDKLIQQAANKETNNVARKIERRDARAARVNGQPAAQVA